MAFIVKSIKTVRNNWKKSIFFTGLAAYGVKYVDNILEEGRLRQAYCKEAQRYGDVPIRTGEKAKKVTVFLNPGAKNGRGKKFFDKNVAPILHLAGFEVRVIKTEYEGQAKKYMEVLDDVDAIVVAGGDGTLLEVVTGLLRRPDADACAKVPIGFVPLGYTNTLAQTLAFRGTSDTQWQVEAAMAVVKGLKQPKDILHIEGSESKNVFAVTGLEWGILTDIKKRKVKNWYFGQLKHYWAYFRETIRQWPPVVSGELSFTAPCIGCSKCYVPPPEIQWKWWHIFLPPQRPAKTTDYSGVENSECGIVHTKEVSNVQLNIEPLRDSSDQSVVRLLLGQESMDRIDFIKKGWQNEQGKPVSFVEEEIKANHLSFTPRTIEGKEESFVIDNEQFETMPIKVSVIKDRISMFCSQPEKPFVVVENKNEK